LNLIRSIHAELPHIKVVAVSGFLEGTLLRTAKNLGAISALRKPVAKEVLLPEICKMLYPALRIWSVREDL